MFVAHLVEVFREVKRVLRSDGSLWLNLSDSYQDKQLVGIPGDVVRALKADGWIWRSTIIWAKAISFCPDYSGSTMPESCTDRPTSSYEYLFLLSKKAHYYYDQEAVREPAEYGYSVTTGNGFTSAGNNGRGHRTVTPGSGGTRNLRSVWAITPQPFRMEMCAKCKTVYTSKEYRRLRVHIEGERKHRICRECGSWEDWLSHFAVFSEALVEPCIKAGTSARGCCPECRGPWERVVESKPSVPGVTGGAEWSGTSEQISKGGPSRGGGFGDGESRTLGWCPTCECYGTPPFPKWPKRLEDETQADFDKRYQCVKWNVEFLLNGWKELSTIPCIVLDPFSGAGTTAKVALELRRNFFGIDLNADYISMSEKRISEVQPRLL